MKDLSTTISVGTSKNPEKATTSIEEAAAPTVPSSVTSIVTLCLMSPSLRFSSGKIPSNSPCLNAASTPSYTGEKVIDLKV